MKAIWLACSMSVITACSAAEAAASAPMPNLIGKTFELATGDDPVEAFAASGVSVTGASFTMKAKDGALYRVDRAAAGRLGMVIVSKVVRDLAPGRAQWAVTGVVRQAVDTDKAFTADCRASDAEITFLYYQPDKAGTAIKTAAAGFRIDARTGMVEPARLSASDCKPAN